MPDTLKIRQASFAGGEISPDLHGRTDLDTYAKSLKSCKNFIVTPYGTLRNRPGFQYLGGTKSNNPARLIPYRYDADNNFVLELTPSVLRVWKNGELQVVDGGSSNDLPIAQWDTAIKIKTLNFTQVGDVMVFTESTVGYEEPYALEWDGATTWTIRAYGTKIATVHPAAGVSALAWHVIANLSKNSSEGPLLEWTWKVSWVNARGEESLPSAALVVGVTPNHMCVMTPDITMPAGVVTSGGALMQWTGTAGGNGYKVYRGVNGMYGFVGFLLTTAGGTVLFQDDGREPDYTQQPIENVAPYGAAGPASSPDCVAYMDQRLIFGQLGITTDDLPRIVGSWLGRPYDWHEQTIISDKGPFDFRLAGAFREQIRHLVPLRDLIALTGNTEYIMSGAQRGIIGPLSIRARPESQHGSSWLKPLVINNSCLYVQDRGGLVRDLFYDFQRDGYNGTELSLRARHLLQKAEIQDWAYAENHDSVVWSVAHYPEAVFDIGADDLSGTHLLGLTYSPDSKILAWHRHQVKGAYYPGFQGFKSSCAIPEGDTDTVYVCRGHLLYDVGGAELVHGEGPVTLNYYIEAMGSREALEPRFGTFLDSFVVLDGRGNSSFGFGGSMGPPPAWGGSADITVTEDEGWAVGNINQWDSNIAVFTAGAYPAVGDVGRHIVLNPDQTGSAGWALMQIIAVNSTTQIRAEIISVNGDVVEDLPVHFRTDAHVEWGFADTAVSGLDHLEAEEVYALVDGVKQGPFTVTGGAITLTAPGVVIVAGLAIDARVETLDAWAPAEPGFKSIRKNLAQVYVEVDTSDGLQAATAAGTFKALPEGTDQVEGPTVATYNHNGRVQIKQDSPLPVTIRAIVREFMVED